MYLDWRKDADKRWIIDTEADSLEPTQFWCAVARNLGSGEIVEFDPEGMYDGRFKSFIDSCKSSFLCGHNFISFDSYHIRKLLGIDIKIDSIVDSLVLSYLYHPYLPGGHSLRAYGERFGKPKLGHEDWSHFSPEMMARCRQDVLINEMAYKALCDRMNKIGFSEKSCEIEHRIRHVIDKQERRGFHFDRTGASELLQRLESKIDGLSGPIRKLFPPTLEAVRTYKYRVRSDGVPFASFLRHQSDYSALQFNEDRSEYTVFEYRDFDIASPKQRVEKLLSLGWQPTEFTPKTEKGGGGNPKINEDALKRFADESGIAEIGAIADWVVASARKSMIEGWLDCCGEDSRIHGTLFTCGAASRRMRHVNPNTTTIPSEANGAWLGAECRALWTASPGRVLVGYDASSLEMRGFGHYIGGGKAADVYIHGKPHQINSEALSEALGFPVVYGGGGAKTCVPTSTKALTRRGWKSYDELIIGEEVLGYNEKTKLKEWTTLRDVTVLEDEVFEFGNSHRKLQATANHRWFVRQRRGKGVHTRPYMSDEVRTTSELNSESNIILNAPFNPDQDRGSKISGLDGKYDVDWIQKVLDMSHLERIQFLQGFLLADGYLDNGGRWCWGQNKNNLAEGALMASYLVNDGQIYVSERNGYNEKMLTVRLSAKGHMTCQTMEKKSLGKMRVWCPTTDLGSWVMRQGYNIAITGNCFYAWLYGAGDNKLGRILGKGRDVGAEVRSVLLNSTSGLKKATREIQAEFDANGGLLRCIDGGFVRCPSPHSALNYKIQSCGAIAMKQAAILFDREISKQGLDCWAVGNMHDECQIDCLNEEIAKLTGEIGVRTIKEAGEELGLNVPLEGEYKIGYNWHLTH